MITRITGKLDSLTSATARIDTGQGLVYEVLLPAFAASRLGGSIGQTVSLQTLHYLEGSSQSTSFIPRLAGFLNESDREFFTALTSVKGIGPKKALRAMTLDSGQIAAAIADRDLKLLQSLPEIGRRMAETVVATLHGKVDRFVSVEPGPTTTTPGPARSVAREALEVLLQLGENRVLAVQWIDEALRKQPELKDSTQLVTAVLRLKTGA